MNTDEKWMQHALSLASQAESHGEVPVGAVLIKDDKLIAEGWNQPILSHDPTAHAEIMAMRTAGHHVSNYRLPGTTLYVTLEPCPMCAGAIVHARIQRLVFATSDPRTGAAGSVMNLLQHEALNHKVDITSGILETECRELIQNFFKQKRKKDE